jgi:uncharacterized protein with HEPN domain
LSRAYRDFLADIVTHAEAAIACIDGLSLDQVAADRLRQLALERCFEIIGEAAGRLAPHIRERYPAIPWAEPADRLVPDDVVTRLPQRGQQRRQLVASGTGDARV